MNENLNAGQTADQAGIVARYISRRRELRIILKPSYHKEVDGRVMTTPGISVRFHDGTYETTDPEIIKALESHPNFGAGDNGEFIRIPDNVLDPLKEREERYKGLDQKEKELAERKAELDAREARIKASEEGGSVESDGLETLNRNGLLEIVEKEGLKKEDFPVGTKNATIIEAIRAKRNEGKEPGGEGVGAAF